MSDNGDFWMGYMMGSGENESGGSGGNGGGIIAVLSMAGGFLLNVLFYTTFGIEIEEIPGLLLIITWIIGSVIVAAFISFILDQ